MISRQSRVWTSSFWRNYTKCMGKNLALVDHLGPLKCLISYDSVIYWWRPKKKKSLSQSSPCYLCDVCIPEGCGQRMLWAIRARQGQCYEAVLTDGGCECQSQEQGKGCHSHPAGEAKGSQMEPKEMIFWCLPVLPYIVSRVPSSIVKQLISGIRILRKRPETPLSWV